MTKSLDTSRGSQPIPGPRAYPIIGNLFDIDPKQTVFSLNDLHKQYGPIYQVSFLGETLVMVSSQEIVHALCDEKKFHKHIDPTLGELRALIGDGLFTAFQGEENWELAHRLLLPAFGPVAIRNMQSTMLDPLGQMLLRWECHAGQPMEVTDQFTRLTFDTIALCSFGYRFNSFHRDEQHPFIGAMLRLLTEALNKPNRPSYVQMFYRSANRQFAEDIEYMNRVCDEIIAERRRNPSPDTDDLLDKMIFGKDARTGEGLSDENIRYQMITFLIAGHETTSGMLSFAMYYMLKNPGVIQKMWEEAEEALKDVGGNYGQLPTGKLTYIDAVLKETLRLNPSAPFTIRTPFAEEGAVLPGGYHVKKGQSVVLSLHTLHRDPEVFKDPEAFRPERWLDGTEYPPDAYKPFGQGGRACIGRVFAIQEAILAMAMIVTRFDLQLADPGYELQIQESLTIKPMNFNIMATPRRKRQSLMRELMTRSGANSPDETPEGGKGKNRGLMHVLYGSNSGSCEALSREVKEEYTKAGFSVTLDELDSAAPDGSLPTDGPVIIVTPSYEGQPADNAHSFVHAIEAADTGRKPLAEVDYCVMGAGHRDWASTLHRIPKLVDARLADLGATRFLPLSLGDAGGDLVSDFEDFKARLRQPFGSSGEDISASLLPSTASPASSLAPGFALARVEKQETLLEPGKDRQAAQYLTLSADQEFATGDYLAVMPRNDRADVERALKVLGLKEDDHVQCSLSPSLLTAGDILTWYVELGQPIGRRHLGTLAKWAGVSAPNISALADDFAYARGQRATLVDALEAFPDAKPPLGHVLYALPKMKPRQYSISSAPHEGKVTLTYTVHPRGVASRYLASLREGDQILCAVKKSSFRPPKPEVPLVMFGAGSGIAPFRGFIADRAQKRKRGRTVLFYGARDAESVLHDEQLTQWSKDGVLKLRLVLSRANEHPQHTLPGGCKYVQDRAWRERAEVRELFDQDAMFYTCGSAALGRGLKETMIKIIVEEGHSQKEAEGMLIGFGGKRYKTDVFS